MISLLVKPSTGDVPAIESTLTGLFVNQGFDAQVSLVIGQDGIVRYFALAVETLTQADQLRDQLHAHGLKVAYS